MRARLLLAALVSSTLALVASAQPVIQWTPTGSVLPRTMFSSAGGVVGNALHITSGIQDGIDGKAHYSYEPGAGVTVLANSLSSYGICGGTNTNFVSPASGVSGDLFFVAGGRDDCFFQNHGRDNQRFDVVAGSWATANCIAHASAGYASASLDGYMSAIGGSSGLGAYENTHSYYDMVTQTNLGTRSMPAGPARAYGAAVGFDGKVFYVGGQFNFMGADIFADPCTPAAAAGGGGGGGGGSFTVTPGLEGFLDCPATPGGCCTPGSTCEALGGCGGAPCGGGGGGGACDPAAACTDRVDIWDPATNMWSAGTPMPKPLAGHEAVMWNYKLYVIGGVDSCLNVNTDILVYSPICDAWATIATIGFGGLAHLAAGVLTDGGTTRIYRAGGMDVITGGGTNAIQYMEYVPGAPALSVPFCEITSPTDAAVVCGDVELDYTVVDGDDVTVGASWKWSTDGGVNWQFCTDTLGGTNPRNISIGLGTFVWDSLNDIGAALQPVTVSMCVTDGMEFWNDRVDLMIECVPACSCIMAGDCDENGGVNILDTFAALRNSAGLDILPPQGLANCNVANPVISDVSTLDGLFIAQYVVGRRPVLDCCP